MNPQLLAHTGTVPGTFRNTNVEKQGTNEDDSQSDLDPEAGIFRSQDTQIFDPEVGHDKVTGVTEEIRNHHDMVTGVTEDIPYCSLGLLQENKIEALHNSTTVSQ